MASRHVCSSAGISRLIALGAAAAVMCSAQASAISAPPQGDRGPSTVLAVVGERGLNVLHEEFRRSGTPPAQVPRARPVLLPAGKDFASSLQEAVDGVLGRVPPNQLLHVAGTRILVYWPRPAGERGTLNLLDRRSHGTGVASAAVGARSGTDPETWLLWVPHSDVTTWSWVAEQAWIDVVSTSYATLDAGGSIGPNDVPRPSERVCPEGAAVREISRRGRATVVAAGNTEQSGALLSPSGLPEAHRVGGVDADGAPVAPSASSLAMSTRAYETGDLFYNTSADPNRLEGLVPFVGTSGSAPRTAARLTRLIRASAAFVGDGRTTPTPGALVVAKHPSLPPPARGPLADGRLTGSELLRVLRHVAKPSAPGPASYLREGYGGTGAATDELAERILIGRADEPARPQEDLLFRHLQALRRVMFAPGRC